MLRRIRSRRRGRGGCPHHDPATGIGRRPDGPGGIIRPHAQERRSELFSRQRPGHLARISRCRAGCNIRIGRAPVRRPASEGRHSPGALREASCRVDRRRHTAADLGTRDPRALGRASEDPRSKSAVRSPGHARGGHSEVSRSVADFWAPRCSRQRPSASPENGHLKGGSLAKARAARSRLGSGCLAPARRQQVRRRHAR